MYNIIQERKESMNINIDSLTCGKCGHRIDVEWYTHDPFDKEYWDAANAGIIDIYEDNSITTYWATCDHCGITDIYYSYEDAVKAAMDGKFKPWFN